MDVARLNFSHGDHMSDFHQEGNSIMKLLSRAYKVVVALCITACFLIIGQWPHVALAQSQKDLSSIRGGRIAVMPFMKGKFGSTPRETIDAGISQLSFNPEKMTPDSDGILTGHVQKTLQNHHGENLIPLAKAMEAYGVISKDDTSDTLRTLAQKVGQALGSDLIMAGNVWRFKERVGRAAGAEIPASVAFGLYLIDVSNGRVLWREIFETSQSPLSDNILDARAFFKKGAKWLTANELALYGVKEILKKHQF
jgi:hypothetical protein